MPLLRSLQNYTCSSWDFLHLLWFNNFSYGFHTSFLYFCTFCYRSITCSEFSFFHRSCFLKTLCPCSKVWCTGHSQIVEYSHRLLNTLLLGIPFYLSKCRMFICSVQCGSFWSSKENYESKLFDDVYHSGVWICF